MMRHQVCQIVIEPSGWQRATTAASQQGGRETGGILLGWRHSTGVYVSQFIEVPDRLATRRSYLRRHALATERLENSIGALPEGSPVGYVGEWHAHPNRQGPSRTDRNQLKRISERRTADITLIVASYDQGAAQWTPVGFCAKSGRVRQAVIVMSKITEPHSTRRPPTEEQ